MKMPALVLALSLLMSGAASANADKAPLLKCGMQPILASGQPVYKDGKLFVIEGEGRKLVLSSEPNVLVGSMYLISAPEEGLLMVATLMSSTEAKDQFKNLRVQIRKVTEKKSALEYLSDVNSLGAGEIVSDTDVQVTREGFSQSLRIDGRRYFVSCGMYEGDRR